MSELTHTPGQPADNGEIDLLALARNIWQKRRLVLKVCGISALIGLVIAFSRPKEYTATIMMAPEVSGTSMAGGLGALAGMAGIDLGSSKGREALSPDLYPNIVQSIPFLVDLFPVEVTDQKGRLSTSLFDYIDEHQKQAWWSVVLQAPVKLMGWTVSLFKDTEEPEGSLKPDPSRLSKSEYTVVNNLAERIGITVDKKVGTTTLNVTMQDPLIASAIADTVMHNLQGYITEYRTNKARQDLIFTEQLHAEARKEYYTAQRSYADMLDRNKALITQSNQTYLERLRNERDLAFSVYNQTAQQLSLAKAKVQEITPVFTVIEPSTVPLRAAGASTLTILIGFIFLGAAGSIGWIIIRQTVFPQQSDR
ncbi:MAG: chain-length determining protein [Rikenellaceae bacterium]|nr:chain-length determining protein [Rikenellaceae bacterium]